MQGPGPVSVCFLPPTCEGKAINKALLGLVGVMGLCTVVLRSEPLLNGSELLPGVPFWFVFLGGVAEAFQCSHHQKETKL